MELFPTVDSVKLALPNVQAALSDLNIVLLAQMIEN